MADIYCPTGEAPQCEWAADAGEFVHAGGTAAGKTIQGVRAVRWRAPADAQAGAKATLRLKVTTPCRVLMAEESLTVRIEDPKGAYARVQWVPIRLRPAGGGRPTAVFAEASLLAAGPLGSFFLVDAPGKRLAHWGQLGPRFAPLGSGPVAGLTAHGEVAFIAQGGQVLAWQPGAEQPQPLAKLPALKRMAGLHANAAGDLYAVDAGESLSLHVLPPKVGSWQQALLEPKGDAAWLAHCALDWHSNDIFAYDSRDRVVRQWRALQDIAYHRVPVAMPAGSAVDRFGPPIAILPRWDADHDVELPVQLVFKSGAVTDRWNYEARPPRWEPLVRRPPRELAAARFTAHSAAAMPDGDLLLGGQATVADETVPLLAQLSPTGELRQTLPLPELPPRCIAAAPDGRRYVLLAHRTQRLVALSPEGWVARDLGVIEAIKPIVRVRADRSSPDHIYLVGSKGSRESAFRLNALNPSAYLELSAQGFPGSQIPDHEAVDVAASPHFVAVLDRGGKILVFANEKPLRLITVVETALRRPAAIALVAASHDADGARQPFLCVLPSGRDATSIYIWQLRTAGGGKPTVTAVGTVPDPANAAARLASPVTLDSAFPDRPGTLFVLDRGGAQVRSFDLPAIVEKLNQRLDPGIPTSPVLDKLPAGEGGVDMAIGPGQLIHIADTAGEAIHSFARCR